MQMLHLDAKPTSNIDSDRLATATELLGGWVWETDQQHRFIYVSDNLEHLTGLPAEHFYGKTRQEVGNNCDPAQLVEFQKSLETHSSFSSVDFKRVDGEDIMHIRITGKPMFDADDQFAGYRGVAYRTTREALEREGRLAAERARAGMSATLEAVVDNYPNPIVIFDQRPSIVLANASYYKMLGLSADEFPAGTDLQRILLELIERNELVGGDAATLTEHHMRMARSRDECIFERSRPNGTVLRVHQIPLSSGGIMRTFIDVTERIEDKWTISSLKNTVAALAEQRG